MIKILLAIVLISLYVWANYDEYVTDIRDRYVQTTK